MTAEKSAQLARTKSENFIEQMYRSNESADSGIPNWTRAHTHTHTGMPFTLDFLRRKGLIGLKPSTHFLRNFRVAQSAVIKKIDLRQRSDQSLLPIVRYRSCAVSQHPQNNNNHRRWCNLHQNLYKSSISKRRTSVPIAIFAGKGRARDTPSLHPISPVGVAIRPR